MKRSTTLILSMVLSTAGVAFAKDVAADAKPHGNMAGMNAKAQSADQKKKIHTTTAVVKKADPEKGKVTLSHGPIPSLNWPAMTMGFLVKEKKLFDQLNVGEKVEIDLVQQGKDYVVVAVR
jgi:Cu(I)/Ag(I) efflux system protein CusF